MSKKTEVIRATKDESKVINLLRSTSLDALISEIDYVVQASPENSANLKTLRSVLKSEFIPPLDLVYSSTVTDDAKNRLRLAFERNRPILFTGEHSSEKMGILKSLFAYYKHTIARLALVDTNNYLGNSSVFIGMNTENISSTYTDYRVLYEESRLGSTRVVINNPKFVEDFMVLHLLKAYNLSTIFISDEHPLETPMLKTDEVAMNLVAESLQSLDCIEIRTVSEGGRTLLEIR